MGIVDLQTFHGRKKRMRRWIQSFQTDAAADKIEAQLKESALRNNGRPG